MERFRISKSHLGCVIQGLGVVVEVRDEETVIVTRDPRVGIETLNEGMSRATDGFQADYIYYTVDNSVLNLYVRDRSHLCDGKFEKYIPDTFKVRGDDRHKYSYVGYNHEKGRVYLIEKGFESSEDFILSMAMVEDQSPKAVHKGTFWKNNKTGSLYQVVSGPVINATNSQDGQIMIVYSRVDPVYGVYAREISEFREKFTPVNVVASED